MLREIQSGPVIDLVLGAATTAYEPVKFGDFLVIPQVTESSTTAKVPCLIPGSLGKFSYEASDKRDDSAKGVLTAGDTVYWDPAGTPARNVFSNAKETGGIRAGMSVAAVANQAGGEIVLIGVE